MTSEERLKIYVNNLKKSEDEIYDLIEESVDNRELQEIYVRILNDINGLKRKFTLDETIKQGFYYITHEDGKIFEISSNGKREMSQEEYKKSIIEGQEKCKKLVEERRRNYNKN